MDLNNLTPEDHAVLALDAGDPADLHDVPEQFGWEYGDQELAGLLAELVATPPPPTLRGRTLRAAVERRAPATRPALGADDSRDAMEGYRRAVAEILDLAATVAPTDWNRPTVHGWTVKGTIAHLAAVEAWFGSKIGAGHFETHDISEDEHIAITAPMIADLSGSSPAEVIAVFADRGGAVLNALGSLAADDWNTGLKFYAFEGPLGGNVIARIFELWIHNDDMRRALGRPLLTPDPGRMQMMTELAVALLPVGLGMAQRPHPGRTARVVLTGPGGGVWTTALDGHSDPGIPDVTLIAEAVDFCRVVSRRLAVDDLDVEMTGDRGLGRDVLVGASMLAAD